MFDQPSLSNRRQFLKQSSSLAATWPLATTLNPLLASDWFTEEQAEVHIFSKHLQFLPFEEMAAKAAEVGFDGVELTVREGGHIEPERVEEDLPKAVKAIREAGLKATMMVTDVTELNALSKTVLETAAEQGIQFYRLGYYYYSDDQSMPDTLGAIKSNMEALTKLNLELGLHGTFQNHAGGLVGAVMWEIWQLINELDPKAMGVQYDIRHAMVDGGQSWENGLRLVRDRISTLAIKDYLWGQEEGEWEVLNMPIGDGLVDFQFFFEILKEHTIQVPMSLHMEYDLSGAEHGEDNPDLVDVPLVTRAMKQDLKRIRDFWKEA